MPAKLDRCVKHVMDQGKDESSAWAICKKSLGLTKTAIAPQGPIAQKLRYRAAAIESNQWGSPYDTLLNEPKVRRIEDATKLYNNRASKVRRIKNILGRLKMRGEVGLVKREAPKAVGLIGKAIKLFARH